jgi:hypothetical protein
MRVYLLRLDGPSRLAEAFERVQDAPRVVSCVVEAGASRLRFLASETVAQPILERIYAEGGLVWCSGHLLEKPDGAQVSPLS